MVRKAVLGGLLAAMCLAGFGCGGNSNPVPQINSLSPASVPAGEGGFILSIGGTNMNGSSTVNFGSNQLTVLAVQTPPCPTQTNCSVVVLVSVPANQVISTGPQQVQVTTAGQSSNKVAFNVVSPQILTMTPTAVPAGAATFPLTLTVLNAAPSVQVTFGTAGKSNPALVPAGPVSCNLQTACSVVVNVPAASVSNAGTMQVSVVNPFAASGGTATTSFLVTAPSGSQFPLAQSASGGTPGNASSTHSSVSDGGVFVAFDSMATNLTSMPTNGLSQVYVTKNCFGATSCTPQTTLISGTSTSAGAGGVNGSDLPVISADGRYVAFESDDTNLVSSATAPVEQIYLFDTCDSTLGAVKNCTPKLTLVSGNGMSEGNAASTNPTISAFGLYVAFQSLATNLTSDVVSGNVQEIYLSQNCTGLGGTITGCTPGITLLSTDSNGTAGDADSIFPSLDPAGIAVAFQSLADNIASGVTSNGSQQIYLRTTCLEGIPLLAGCGQQTLLISADTGNGPGTGDSLTPSLTDNGNLFAVFASNAPNLLPAGATQQIVGTTLCPTLPTSVACGPPSLRVLSVGTNGTPGAGVSSNPSVSGTRVVFTSMASLVSGVTGQQVYGVPVCAGPCGTGAIVISVDNTGTPIGGDFGSAGGGGMAAFFTTGSSGAPGVGQIFLAAPF